MKPFVEMRSARGLKKRDPFCSLVADSHSRNHRRLREAFTLTELLVVILTLGILGSFIYFAPASSTEQSRRAVCLNNLRQMGTAMKMYASDNREYLPFPNWGTENPGWLYSRVNGAIPDPTVQPYVNDPATAYATGLWFPYVKTPAAYLCPVDVESLYYSQRVNKLSSYVMNGAVCGYSTTYRSCKLSDAWSPECYLLWEPDESLAIGAFVFNDASSYPDRTEGVGPLHTANGAQILQVGGNVRFVSKQKSAVEQAGTGKTLAWWSPFSTTGH